MLPAASSGPTRSRLIPLSLATSATRRSGSINGSDCAFDCFQKCLKVGIDCLIKVFHLHDNSEEVGPLLVAIWLQDNVFYLSRHCGLLRCLKDPSLQRVKFGLHLVFLTATTQNSNQVPSLCASAPSLDQAPQPGSAFKPPTPPPT